MRESTKEVLSQYQVRKTRKQKRAFAEFVQRKAQENGYYAYLEKGSLASENIVVGDVSRARVIYTAHYDTCARMPFPNLITPKNIPLFLLYQLLLSAVLILMWAGFGILLWFGASRILADSHEAMQIARLGSLIFLNILMWLLVAGPANPHTVNDNTSGVVTLLSIMESLPSEFRSEVAFVFFDLEEVGLVGSSSFAATHKAILKDKLLVNFDCVSDGETMLFCLKKKTHPFSSVIERAFISDETVSVEIAKNGFVYPSDQMMMPCGIGVAALKKTKKGILYMDKIHTKNDTVFREENIEFLTKGAVALVSLLGQDENDTVNQ